MQLLSMLRISMCLWKKFKDVEQEVEGEGTGQKWRRLAKNQETRRPRMALHVEGPNTSASGATKETCTRRYLLRRVQLDATQILVGPDLQR